MQTISSASKCYDRDIISSLMKTLKILLLSAANLASVSLILQLWSYSYSRLKKTMLHCSAEPQPPCMQTKRQRLLLFIEASNNIWCCHVCLGVKMCVWDMDSSVCSIGKDFCYKKGKSKHQLWNNLKLRLQASQILSTPHAYTHAHISTHTVQTPWSFVMPHHGLERSTLKGKDCVHATAQTALLMSNWV